MAMPEPSPLDGSSLDNLRLAVSQKAQGVTGDQHSPWTRVENTPGEMLEVGKEWVDSVGQTSDAWSNINAPVNPGQPDARPPTEEEKTVRVIRAVQQTVDAVMDGLGLLKDALDVGFANLTAPIAALFPSLPAATLLSPYLGTPHAHPKHPPSGPPPVPPTPLPSFGIVLLGVSVNVLINNLPAARCEDIGLAPTCCAIPPAWFKIMTGSSNVFIGGSRAARLLDICKACPTIKEPPSRPAGRGRAASGRAASDRAAGGAGTAMEVGEVAAGTWGVVADVAEAAVEDDAAMASAKALSAAMSAAQTAMDVAKMAVESTMWTDIPVIPPHGSIGAIIDPSHFTVLIGGFPMVNIPDPAEALLNRLKRSKAKAPASNQGCGREGEPIDVVSGANLEETVDYVVEGALPIRWQRLYDSAQAGRHGPLGWGYRHFYERTLVRDLDGFRYVDEQGTTFSFPTLRADGESSATFGFVLRRLSPSAYRIDHAGQPSMEFAFDARNSQARLVRFSLGEHNLVFRYDAADVLVGMDSSDGAQVRIKYDARQLITGLELAMPGDLVARVIAAYEYDEGDHLLRWVDANGHQATFAYDSAHRMVRKGDRRGYSYHYEYDSAGRCTHSFGDDGLYDIRLRYLPEMRATEVVYSSGATWLYFYDENGTITRILDPYGSEKKRIVGPLGHVIQEIDANGNATQLIYDSAGGFVGRRDPFGNIFNRGDDLRRINTNPLEAPTTVAGWIFGHRLANSLTHTKPQTSVRTDAMGRALEIVEADGRRRRWSFDPNGNPTSCTNGDGHTRKFEYASWNLLGTQIEPCGAIIAFRYNDRERITEVTDGGGTVSGYGYDYRDRLVEVRRHGKVRERYVRDPTDNLIEKCDGGGKQLLSFDIGAGNLKRVRRLASGETHYFDYDDRGRITRAATEELEVCIGYDVYGRCSVDERDGRGIRHEQLSGHAYQSTVLGRYTTLYRTEGPKQRIVVDPTRARHVFRTDDHGQVAATLANGTSMLSRFDGEGRCLSTVVTWKRSPGVRWERIYEYSPEGMLLWVRDNSEGEHRYEYDPSHRLMGETTPAGHRDAYQYDRAGNLLAKPGLQEVRLQSGNRLAAANGHTFQYNSRDHIGQRTGPDGSIYYHYDSCDRLARVVVGDRVWSATYDPLGRRTEKGFDGEARTTYYWDDNRPCAEIAPSGRVRIYVYADRAALVPFMFVDYDDAEQPPSAGRRYFIHANQIGVPVRVVDDEGRAVWRARIDPYGQAHVDAQSRIDCALRFPGHWDDAEIGLFYNRFRYYSPELGRYLQSDPLGIAGGYNLYAYPAAPLTQVDLFGLAQGHSPNNEGDSGQSRTGQNEEEVERATPEGSEHKPLKDMNIDELGAHVKKRAEDLRNAFAVAHPIAEEKTTLSVGVVQKDGDPATRKVVVTTSADDYQELPEPVLAAMRPDEHRRYAEPTIVTKTRKNPEYDPDQNRSNDPRKNPQRIAEKWIKDPSTGKWKRYTKATNGEPVEGTQHHAEQRMENGARENGEEVLAQQPTKRCCPGCKKVLKDSGDLSKIPNPKGLE
jgi:RHS repeat-associated protein